MSPIKFELPLLEGLASPIAQSIGQTISSLWDICFGWIDNIDEKIKYKRMINLNKFKNSLETGISNIPLKDIREPKMSIVGPAMEASKYYFDEDILREMFANIIVRSMDANHQSKVHPSFIEIIKQLSANDAKILSSIATINDYLPAAQLSIIMKRQGIFMVGDPPIEHISPITFTYHLHSDVSEEDQIISLDNLTRLGLTTFVATPLVGENAYDFVKDTECYHDSLKEMERLRKDNQLPDCIKIREKCLHLTSLGLKFCEICISNTLDV